MPRAIARAPFGGGSAKGPTFFNDFTTNAPNDSRLVCVRANAVGTYFDVNNVMQTASANTMRIDYGPVALGTTNFFWPSFVNSAAIWNSLTGSTWVKNADIAPDGTKTAGLMVADTSTGPHWSTPNINNNVAFLLPSTTYTYSVFLKAGTTTRVGFGFGNSSNWTGWPISLLIDLQAQTVSGANGTGTITAYAGGWFRVSMSATTAASGLTSTFLLLGANNSSGVASYAGAGQSFYAWGFQCQLGATATTLVPTITAKVTVPKSLGLLVEEARTNSCIQSAMFTSWGGVLALTQTQNALLALDGTTSATLLTEDTTASSEHYSAAPNSGLAVNQAITFSFYVKDVTRRYVGISMYDVTATANNAVVHFDLTLGTASAVTLAGAATNGSASITATGNNGWYRVSLTATLNSVANVGTICRVRMESALGTTSYTGDGVSAFYVWGAQIEAGGFATSLIPTTTVAVSRAADSVTMPLGTWFKPATSTMAVTAQQAGQYNKAVCVLAFQEAATNRTSLNITAGNSVSMFDQTAGMNAGLGVPTSGSIWKATFAYRATSQVGSLNGAAVTTQALTITTLPITMAIGSVFTGSYFNGWVRQVTYWNYQLSNAAVIQTST